MTDTMFCRPNDFTWQFPAVTSFDWKQYTLDVEVPVNAKALEVRLHVYSRFTGTIYWDDLTVEKLDIPTITEVGGFEGTMPAFWNVGNTGGAKLTWATDQHRSGLRSLEDREDHDGRQRVVRVGQHVRHLVAEPTTRTWISSLVHGCAHRV